MLTPADRAARAELARSTVADLNSRDVVCVAVTWVDTSGLTRVKAVPLAHLPLAAAWGIGGSPSFDVFLSDDSMARGRFAGGPVGDLRLHPDLSRATVLAAQPGWAWAPGDRYRQDGRPHPMDARLAAQREVARLAELGYTVRAAFEVEWCVFEPVDRWYVPIRPGPGYGMSRLVDLSDYLADLLRALSTQGLAVEQVHPESGQGQYEISVAAADPVSAADTFVLVRETIRAVTAGRGLRATFAPKVLPGQVGNGAHLHLSVWKDGKNTFAGGAGRYGMRPEGEAFVAGILHRLPALLAVCAPSVASYLRIVPSQWAGAYACWGLENREAAVRFVTGPVGNTATSANVEIKSVDPAANPYLAVAGVLAVGRAGLEAKLGLPEPVEVDPETLGAPERAERGIHRLPTSLPAAVQAFAGDEVLGKALGPELADTIVAVRQAESTRFAGASPDEITERLRWVY